MTTVGRRPRLSAAQDYWQPAGSSVAVCIRPQPHPDDEHARLEHACDDHKEVDTDYRRQYSFSSRDVEAGGHCCSTSILFRRSSSNIPCLTQSVGGLSSLSYHPNAVVVAGVASSVGAAPDAVPASVSASDERIIKTKLKYFLNLTKELSYGP